MNRKSIIVIFLFILIISILPAQTEDMKILAVTNIDPVEVNEYMAAAVREMVEAALIKTEKFQVINYANMEEILEVQAVSLSGCTDDACAVEIGKLLSAEEIIIGSLSKIEEKMILSIRLIDVETGHNLKAEIATIQSIDTLQDDVFTAAYKLVDLVYIGESDYRITDKGSVYVTAPEGMTLTVSIDGDEKGETPVLIKDLPYGTHILKAESGTYVFENEITINSKDIIEIITDISLFRGNALVTVLPLEASGYTLSIDDKKHNPGLIRDLSVGIHEISVDGNGWYHHGEFTIEKNDTIDLDVFLSETGTITVELPDNVDAQILDESGIEITNSQEITDFPVFVGNYKVFIDHPDYDLFEYPILVKRNENTHLNPDLTFSKLYRDKLQLVEYQNQLNLLNKRRKTMNIIGSSLAGAGVLFTGITGLGEYLIYLDTQELNNLYSQYSDTHISSEAELLWSDIEDKQRSIENIRYYRTISLVAAGVTVLSSVITFLLRPEVDDVENAIDELSREIGN